MASLSLNTNISSSISSFTFTTPIKLDRSNYTIWKSQILSLVLANELETLLDGSRICLDQYLAVDSTSTNAVAQENPTYAVWKKQDQMLLSWLLSSISVEILSLVVTSKTSNELWTSLEQQFGSETAAKKAHLKMMLNNLKKGSMSITDYFSKLRYVTDEPAVAGQPYYLVVVYIEANVLKMSVNEAYSMLLTHEARLESAQSNASKETKMNYAANMVQTGNNQKKPGNNGGWNNNNQGNWNGNYGNKGVNSNWNGNNNNKGGYGSGRGGFGGQNPGRGWNGNQSRGGFSGNGGFSRNAQGHYVNQNQASKNAFMVTSEGIADQGWYLDNGATHHLTNNVQNLTEGQDGGNFAGTGDCRRWPL